MPNPLVLTPESAARLATLMRDAPTEEQAAGIVENYERLPPADRFSINDIAQILSISYHTARNMVNRGAFGEPRRDGAHSVVTIAGLRAYLQHEINTHTEERNALSLQLRSLSGELTEQEGQAIVAAENATRTDSLQQIAASFEYVSNAFGDMVEEISRATTRVEELRGVTDARWREEDIYTARLETMVREIHGRMIRDAQRVNTPAVHQYITDLYVDVENGTFVVSDRAAITFRATNLLVSDDALTRLTEESGPVAVSRETRQLVDLTSRQELSLPSAEFFSTQEPGVASHPLIPDDQPDRIVEVSRGSARQQFRTRRDLSVGELVFLDETGDLEQSNPTSASPVGVVTSVRPAVPDASEQIASLMEFEILFGARSEILHPYRGETMQIETTADGVPSFYENPHFLIQRYETNPERRETTIWWRAV
jgi:hypothetical protein